MSETRDTHENHDQPPEVDIHGDRNQQLPPVNSAALRILEFVSWFGDGEVKVRGVHASSAPRLFARDLESLARFAEVAK